VGGCNNPRSVVTTRYGVVYQDASDGGIYLIRLDTSRIYLGAGIENYKGQPIVAAVYDTVEDQVRLFITDDEAAIPEITYPPTSDGGLDVPEPEEDDEETPIAAFMISEMGQWRNNNAGLDLLLELDTVGGQTAVWDIDFTQFTGATSVRVTLAAAIESDGDARTITWRVRIGAGYDASQDETTHWATQTEVLSIEQVAPHAEELVSATGTVAIPVSATAQLAITCENSAWTGDENNMCGFTLYVEVF
jgi:hypothetical protein